MLQMIQMYHEMAGVVVDMEVVARSEAVMVVEV